LKRRDGQIGLGLLGKRCAGWEISWQERKSIEVEERGVITWRVVFITLAVFWGLAEIEWASRVP
jgi:hypothetical protein